jgi:hypothetical protein
LLFTSAATPTANPFLLKAELLALPPYQTIQRDRGFEDPAARLPMDR